MLGINFIKSSKESDKELFFGPIKDSFWGDEKFIEIEDKWIMAHILHSAGVFASVSEARRNGWDKPIEKGFHSFKVGKNKLLISIFLENENAY